MRTFFLFTTSSLFVVVSATAIAIAVAACSSDNAAPSSSSDASIANDGASSSSSGGDGDVAACTTLAQEGASVDILATAAAQPDATGGTPVDGVYTLMAIRAFTTILPEGGKIKTFGAYTLSVTGKKFEQTITNGDNVTTIASGDLESSDVSFTATPSCQQPASADGGVDIVAGKFTVSTANTNKDAGTDGGAPSDAGTTPTTLKMYVVEYGVTAELLFVKK